MTSVQKFIRQINVPNSLFPPVVSGAYYNFVAGSGNYVGNYPPGYMVAYSGVPPAAQAAGAVLRDMGKTIKCPVGAVISSVLTFGTEGYFREVQVINPEPVASATASSAFGIGFEASGANTLPQSGNVGDTGYNTFYIPIVIGGVVASTPGSSNPATAIALPSAYPPFGGQM